MLQDQMLLDKRKTQERGLHENSPNVFWDNGRITTKIDHEILNAFGWVTRRHTSLKNENCHLLALTVRWNTKKNVWKA